MRAIQGVFAAGLFFLATGFTECEEYFTDVRVPPSDSDRPLPFGGVYDVTSAEYLALQFGTSPLTYQAAAGQSFVIVGGGVDNGGVKDVELDVEWHLYCIDSPLVIDSDRYTLRASQAGRPGATVSSGVYAAELVTVPECDHGVPGVYRMTFRATAVDFHRNRITSPEYVVTANLP